MRKAFHRMNFRLCYFEYKTKPTSIPPTKQIKAKRLKNTLGRY